MALTPTEGDYYPILHEEELEEPGMMLVADFFRLLEQQEQQQQDEYLDIDIDPSQISSLTPAQDKALSIIPVFSGLLSIWGSSNIIYLFLQTDKDKRNVYKRIMFGLSVSDLLASLVYALQAFMIPAATSQRVWAFGTDATCNAIAFFQQLAVAEVWYNGMLSVFFLLKIKYAVEETVLAAKYEPWMHGWSIGYNLITALVGAAAGWYGELVVGHYCWFTGPGTLFAYFATAAPFALWMIAIITNNVLIYRHVRRTIQEQDGHNHSPSSSSMGISPLFGGKSSNNLRQSSGGGSSSDNSNSQEGASSCVTGNSGDSGVSLFSNEEVREQQREAARRKYQQERQNERLRAIAIQASLYVGSFLLTHMPTFIMRVTSAIVGLSPSDEGQFFPLLLIQAIFLPLQGLFNYLIYSRPLSYWREVHDIKDDLQNKSIIMGQRQFPPTIIEEPATTTTRYPPDLR